MQKHEKRGCRISDMDLMCRFRIVQVFLSKGDKIYDFLLLLGASGAAMTV